METIRYSLDQGIATVTFDEPDSPVNTMKPQWQQDMIALAEQLSADAAQLRGVLLTSAKTTFFAGADLKGVLKLGAEDVLEGNGGGAEEDEKEGEDELEVAARMAEGGAGEVKAREPRPRKELEVLEEE